jgi:hypothetical protein
MQAAEKRFSPCLLLFLKLIFEIGVFAIIHAIIIIAIVITVITSVILSADQ